MSMNSGTDAIWQYALALFATAWDVKPEGSFVQFIIFSFFKHCSFSLPCLTFHNCRYKFCMFRFVPAYIAAHNLSCMMLVSAAILTRGPSVSLFFLPHGQISSRYSSSLG